MNRSIALTLLALTTVAAAQTTRDEPDCSTLAVGSFLYLNYMTRGTPSNQGDVVFKNLGEEPFEFDDCGYAISSDPSKVSIRAKSLDDLFRLLEPQKAKQEAAPYIYVALISDKDGFDTVPINIDLPAGEVTIWDNASGLFKSAAIKYRINGGALQPLYVNNRFSPFRYAAGTRTLDFFTLFPSDKYAAIQRFQVDLEQNSLTLWYRHDFPSK